jgi:hypothetical protein
MASATATSGAKRETPERFLKKLATAFRTGDAKFLLARLDPAVLDRYGKPLCKGFVSGLEDETAAFDVIEVGEPEDYDYVSEGETTTVPDTVTVTVDATRDGATSTEEVHLAADGKRLTWFTRCQPTGADAVIKALGPYTGTYVGTWNDTRFMVGGDITIEVVIDRDAQTLNLSLTFTGQLFGAPAPATEQLAPVSLDIAEFGGPVTGTSATFGPYSVTYSGTGAVIIQMPQCPPGSCTLDGVLKPGELTGTVSVQLRDGTTSQGTVELTKQ